MNGALELRGQVQDGVVGRWLREVGKIGIGQDGIAVVQGYKNTSDFRTWLIVVPQITHPCCRQGEFLVHVF